MQKYMKAQIKLATFVHMIFKKKKNTTIVSIIFESTGFFINLLSLLLRCAWQNNILIAKWGWWIWFGLQINLMPSRKWLRFELGRGIWSAVKHHQIFRNWLGSSIVADKAVIRRQETWWAFLETFKNAWLMSSLSSLTQQWLIPPLSDSDIDKACS